MNKDCKWIRKNDGKVYCSVCGARNMIAGYSTKYLIKYLEKK